MLILRNDPPGSQRISSLSKFEYPSQILIGIALSLNLWLTIKVGEFWLGGTDVASKKNRRSNL